MVDVLREQAKVRPEKTVLRFLEDGETQETALTFEELDRRARAIAARLQQHLKTGDRALLLYPPGLDFLTGLFGCFYAGVVAVPAYPPRVSRNNERLEALLKDCAADTALTTKNICERYRNKNANRQDFPSLTWLATEEIRSEEWEFQWRPPDLNADSCAFLQYTSGSTAQPKGVALSHANLWHNLKAMAKAVDADENSVAVSWLPPYHDMGLISMLLQPVFLGAQSILMSPMAFLQRPFRWLQAISKYRATAAGAPNFAYELCARRITREQRASLDLSCWQIAFSGAERIRKETLERFADAFEDCGFRRDAFSCCYGLAESTLAVTIAKHGQPLETVQLDNGVHLVGCGQPVDGHIVAIVDPAQLNLCQEPAIGEIWVAGPSVADGYWNKPELNQKTFAATLPEYPNQKFLRTGDLGFIHKENLYISGRSKDLIIVLGRNYYPEDIEHTALQADVGLAPSGAAAFSLEIGGQERLIVAVELESPKETDTEEIAERIRAAIAKDHELSVYDVVLLRPRGLPRTTSGKIQRHECRIAYLEARLPVLSSSVLTLQDSLTAEQPDQTASPIGKKIIQAMDEVLGLQEVGLEDNFFDLGGQSLMATQLMSRIRERLGIDLPLRLIFESPTPASLAQKIEEMVHSRIEAPALVKIQRDGELPLTFSQERMWFMHQLDPAGSAYNVCGALQFHGPLQVAALERSLNLIVERHEILRSNYETYDGKPRIVIHPQAHHELLVQDLTNFENPETEARRRASDLAASTFDLASGPLLKVGLYKITADRHLFAVNFHHIIADGWSMTVVLREMLLGYDALIEGRAPGLRTPEFQYLDYAHWQRQWLSGEVLQQQLAYWKERLASPPEPLNLPFDRSPSAKAGSGGARIQLPLPNSLMDELGHQGLKHEATLFMVLLAAFKVALYRHSNQTDIAVGTPIANRNWMASEGLIGTLVNTLVMRTDLSDDPTFTELLLRVRETAISAYANQDLPFEQLVEALELQRVEESSPLFQVMFDYQRLPMPEGKVQGLECVPEIVDRQAAQFDLVLAVIETGSGHLATLEYSTELFDADTIHQFVSRFLTLLESIAENPEMQVSSLDVLPKSERTQLLNAWNRTQAPFDLEMPFFRQFEQHVRLTPEKIALIYDGRGLTYAELNAAANQLAHELNSRGLRPDDLVAVCMQRSEALLITLLGVLKAGCAYIPIDPGYPAARILQVIEDGRPKLILTEAGPLDDLHLPNQETCLKYEELQAALRNRSTSNLETQPDPENLAYVIFTSGSTGRPKGVQIPHRALTNFLLTMQETPGFEADDRLLAVTTISFDIAGLEIYLPLISGGCVEIADTDLCGDGTSLRRKLESGEINIMQATPATWRMLMAAGWQGCSELKVLCGGEALPQDLAKELVPRCKELWNMYGPTETTIWSTVERIEEPDQQISIGKPIGNTRIYILDKNYQPVPVGVIGELYIGGDGVSHGYLGQEHLTTEKFLPNMLDPEDERRIYRTGDSARYRKDGSIDFLGRLDHQVKVRGYRIELGDIESHILEHNKVKQAVAIVREDTPGDQRIVVYMSVEEIEQNEDDFTSELRDFLTGGLPAYMMPSDFVFLEVFPLTPNGKIDRKALPAPETEENPSSEHVVAPRNQSEMELLSIWEEVLNKRSLGVTDSFFDVGGHSLLAVRLFAQIHERMGVKLPLSSLFQAPTVEQLARLVQKQQEPHEGSSLVRIQPHGKRPAIFWVHTLGGGGGGGLLRYRDLALRLHEEQPSFGFKEPDSPFDSVEAMAAAYIDTMRMQQPHGPYYLGGYCFGGNVAHEIACQLQARGEKVGMLALLDSFPPQSSFHVSWANPKFLVAALTNLPRWYRKFKRRDSESKKRYLGRKLSYLKKRLIGGKTTAGQTTKGPDIADVLDLSQYPEEFRETAKTHWDALMNHEHKVFHGSITLIRPERENLSPLQPEAGWTQLSTKTVDLHVVSGSHAEILQSPHVEQLAKELHLRLEKAQQYQAA